MKVTMISNCCTLIEMGGKNILTDPWMTEPIYWGRLYHRFGLGLKIEDLPPIDLILASHGHDDHLDPATLKQLDKTTPVAVLNKAAKKAMKLGFTDVRPMAAGDDFTLDGLEVHARFGRHPGGLVTYVLKADGQSLFFAGDSIYDEGLLEIGREFPNTDVSLLPISGGRMFFGKVHSHMNPQESARLAGAMGTKAVIPCHYHFKFEKLPTFLVKKFGLDVEGKLEEFQGIARDICPNVRVVSLAVGKSWEIN